MKRTRPIVIVKAGDPVPSVLASRGEFSALIEGGVGEAWSGEFASFDCRVEPGPRPESAAAFIITGSSANVPLREAWMIRTEAWLRDVVAAGTPVLGICFGHQILGQALGGEVRTNPRGREIGTIRIDRIGDDPIFHDFPQSFDANATHVDTVIELPPGAVALARSSLDDHQAIRFTPSCYGVQFHPEIDGDVMKQYIDARRPILESEGLDAHAIGFRVTDTKLSQRVLRSFVRNIVTSD